MSSEVIYLENDHLVKRLFLEFIKVRQFSTSLVLESFLILTVSSVAIYPATMTSQNLISNNMAQDGSHLEMLPPELHIMIMSHVASPQSLSSLIRASPKFYHVFLLSKQRVLSAVIHKILHPEVLPDALAATFLSRREAPLPARDDILAFINSYPGDGKKVQVTELIPLSTCITVCQLHQSVEYFSRSFVDRCVAFSGQHGVPLGVPLGANSFSLSWTEEDRIHRALYRLQLCGHVFRFIVDNVSWSCASDQVDDFLWNFFGSFPAYQVEELVCLLDHFKLPVWEVYDKIEDRSVDSVPAEVLDSDEPDEETKENSHRGTCWKTLSHLRPPDHGNCLEPDTCQFLSEIQKFWRFHYIGNPISDGLPLIRNFLEFGDIELITLSMKFGVRRM